MTPDSLPPAARKPKRLRRWFGYALVAVTCVVLALILISALARMPKSDVVELAATVRSFKLFGVLAQVAVVIWIAAAWRRIVDFGLRRGVVARHEYHKVLALRWTVFAFLVSYLLLVPIGPATIYRFLTQ